MRRVLLGEPDMNHSLARIEIKPDSAPVCTARWDGIIALRCSGELEYKCSLLCGTTSRTASNQ